MNKVTFAIFAFLALAAVCLVPVSNDVDADITPEDVVVKTEGTQVFTIVYNDAVEEGKKLTYSATVNGRSFPLSSSSTLHITFSP